MYFTQQARGCVETRSLPPVKVGDYLVFPDTGAYGATISFNYNNQLLLPEVLFENEVPPYLIRQSQTIE
jgi:diaminopimelate decarboxylase